MAQVTMTGVEYRGMIKMEEQREELLNIFVKAQQVTFDPESERTYSVGTFEEMEFPKWVTDLLLKAMEAQLKLKDDEELAVWFQSGMFYYNPLQRNFNRHEWDGYVDMMKYSEGLCRRYEVWKASQEFEKEVREDEE